MNGLWAPPLESFRTIGGTCVVGFGHIVRPRPRCSGLNKHVNFGVCLFLTGVREVPESSDTSTAIGSKSPRPKHRAIGVTVL